MRSPFAVEISLRVDITDALADKMLQTDPDPQDF
jgi:hypothetical protein